MSREYINRWKCDVCDATTDQVNAENLAPGWVEIEIHSDRKRTGGTGSPLVAFCPEHGQEVRDGLLKAHGPQTYARFT